jgi:hypothetical protein
MIQANINPPLTNVQMELLKVFATQVSDADLLELKKMIAKFLLEKARNRADQIWEARGYDKGTVEQWLNED